ncbi:hypothetical protein PR003_g28636 [Phytophthora rubi]|uniref:Uncharacterized protein n=1 Tax=Phytophthora rubi TaxID=129364 RepID=A0A6A4BT79_9STRA|nr:hypothetical protein PR001_g27420 [Phytophthora rubi]KAE8970981.1 hypothetical protein PR002_g26957 [Phytophthora rubi]KAE9278027.1 hypothetical protein PR003_g28636 [Phytophthora rubi]
MATMTTAMEWEAPIPVWIDSISIDVDEVMAASDLMDSIPLHPVVTPTGSPCTPTATEQLSMFGVLQDLKPIDSDDFELTLNVESINVITESPVKKSATSTPRSISPVKRQPTAKPPRRTGRKIHPDPVGRKENRKDKQRGYEKGYRRRQKDKRAEDEAEWIQLETQVREILAKRTSAVVLGPQDELQTQPTPSTVSIRQRYLELLQEERALREAEVLDSCMLTRDLALALWGTSPTRRNVREQLNALPGLRECLTFEFSW